MAAQIGSGHVTGPSAEPADGVYILIVDDDSDLRQTLCDVLADEGLNTIGVANGREALTHLRAAPPPRLILLDLMMPVMNGWQLSEVLRGDDALSRIPVLIMTAGRPPADDQFPGMQVIRKPVDLEQLLSEVQRYLR